MLDDLIHFLFHPSKLERRFIFNKVVSDTVCPLGIGELVVEYIIPCPKCEKIEYTKLVYQYDTPKRCIMYNDSPYFASFVPHTRDEVLANAKAFDGTKFDTFPTDLKA